MAATELKVPDIGDFKDIEIIEVLVKVGDRVEQEQSLITVESDKASMEIPSSAAGTITQMLVKVGDKVSQGSVIATFEADGAGPVVAPAAASASAPPASPLPKPTAAHTPAAAQPPAAVAGPAPRPSPAAGPAQAAGVAPVPATDRHADLECDVLVLGGGPGGYSAAFRAADLGLKSVIVERYATLGGVCLNVGCIPSKALLHAASVVDAALALAEDGISFAPPKIDLDKLRGWKDKVVARMTGGLSSMAKGRKVEVVRGYGRFLDPHHLAVELTSGDGQEKSGGQKVIRFKQAIIAAGSQAIRLPFLPQDPRIVDSTGALLLRDRPKRMLVIGGGIIGLEMATVYSTLGAKVDVVEMLDSLMTGADRDMVKVWQKYNEKRFGAVMLQSKTVKAEATKAGIKVSFEGKQAPAEAQLYDLVLCAVGRSPNGGKIDAERAGVAVTERGFIEVDSQMRTNVAHIFAIGDLVGQPMLAHKAVHEGHVAAEVAAGQKRHFDARVIPSVAYTDPELAWVGITEDEAKAQGVKLGKAVFPWAASGRAIANGRDEGFTKLLFDETTHRIVGGAIVGTHAGDMIGELALAIEMGADATDIAQTIHPHPTLGESIGMAAELYEGVCTDLPPPRKR